MRMLELDDLSEIAKKEAIEINAIKESTERERRKQAWVTLYMRAFPKMRTVIGCHARPCMNGNIAFGRWISEGYPCGYKS